MSRVATSFARTSVQAARTLAAYVATGIHTTCENVVVTIDEDEDEATRLAQYAADYLDQVPVGERA